MKVQGFGGLGSRCRGRSDLVPWLGPWSTHTQDYGISGCMIIGNTHCFAETTRKFQPASLTESGRLRTLFSLNSSLFQPQVPQQTVQGTITTYSDSTFFAHLC